MKKATNFKTLSSDKLTWKIHSDQIPYKTSKECKACEGIIGQERAHKAIQTGLNIKSLGYNIFTSGIIGTGRTTTIKQLLGKLKKDEKTPDDLLIWNQACWKAEKNIHSFSYNRRRFAGIKLLGKKRKTKTNSISILSEQLMKE